MPTYSISELERLWDISAAAVDDAWADNAEAAAEDALIDIAPSLGTVDNLIDCLSKIAALGHRGYRMQLRDLRSLAEQLSVILRDEATRRRLDDD